MTDIVGLFILEKDNPILVSYREKILNISQIRKKVIDNNSQSHLCICDTALFEDTVNNGVYGFPHSGKRRLKSFWRAIASMYNIGSNDLIFIYRTKGNESGCKEIHGVFRIHNENGTPAVYYDLNSLNFPMKVKGKTDCKVRFLFESFNKEVYSISDNYELIKKYESREIWGYRHPAVMNIGAARKKSVTSFTMKQTIVLLDLFEKYGIRRTTIPKTIPTRNRINYFLNLPGSQTQYRLDDNFITTNFSEDEAFLYSYILMALERKNSPVRKSVLSDFSAINDNMLNRRCKQSFTNLSNIMCETIITNHLQDELDVVLTDSNDSTILFLEFKTGTITKNVVKQVLRYVDLLKTIFPKKEVFANVIGSGKEQGINIDEGLKKFIKLVYYKVESKLPLLIRFGEFE